ncbi:glycerophosphoryl diester phosphodiesterase [Murinocardiopsis flavida]|uniref:Glycerophosphoryl diester phosphodiesterase n=1 Tax=Murinocardiopsis flavida TaxID=645275 RepID=A0A2P8DH14_9ACTN|nr:glycerophosphodiester phosphodiesterase [Murinocardiopsis flavida]PSK96501.1 glycerophosphoryl diester phosphodiesterase [Murinocardiopsis flavida]
MTLAIAHRGDPVQFRENTLPALRSAAAAGADLIQVNANLTSDGHVVLLHTDAFERHWNLTRPLSGTTLAELAARGGGADLRAPTLMEALAEFGRTGTAGLLIDVCSAPAALAADELVAEHKTADHVLYTGSIDAMRALRARRPDAPLCLEWDQPGYPPAELWQELRPRFYTTRWDLLTRELVAEVHRHGFGVCARGVNDLPEMVRLAGTGVDAISTDYPADLVKLVKDPARGRQEPYGQSIR